MTTLKKIVSVLTIGATVLATVGTVAQAHDWQGRGPGYGYAQGSGYGGYQAPFQRPAYGYVRPHHHDRTGERIATGVAIGVGALILGSVLAGQSHRGNGYGRY